MSADNYLYVRKWDGKYFVEHRFASSDYDDEAGPSRHARQYETWTSALGDDTEYGVRVSASVQADMQADADVKGRADLLRIFPRSAYANPGRPFFGRKWIWTGALGRDGYGLTSSRPLGRAMMTAHRAAYLISHPDQPHPPMVLHSCDTPLCCNPVHLFAGDQAVNMADMKSKGRAGGGHIVGTPSVKITDELARVVAAERGAGSSIRTLGTKYGLSAPGIRHVLKRVAEGRIIRRKAPKEVRKPKA